MAMSGRVCSICLSNNRNEVEDALIRGDSVRAIAGRHGLSKSAVSRHRQNCLAPKVVAAARLLTSAEETRSEVVQAEEILTGEILPSHGDVLALTGLLSRLARSLDRLDGAAMPQHARTPIWPWHRLVGSYTEALKLQRGCSTLTTAKPTKKRGSRSASI